MFQIQYRRSVKGELKKLPIKTRREIVRTILKLSKNPRPTGYSKLAGTKNLYRLRKGTYRIVYSIHNKKLTIIIIRVGHRKDIYKNLK